jgi:FkbM family methyltransferase
MTVQHPVDINFLLSYVGHVSRHIPYFPGKWRLVDYIFGRFQKTLLVTEVVSLHGGTFKMQCNLWDSVQNNIWWLGVHEYLETKFIKRIVKPGMAFVDIGANVGFYSLLASSLVGDSGRVHAFEPASQSFNHLSANIILNDFSNIIVNRSALSDRETTMTLHLGPTYNSGTASLVDLPWLSSDGEKVSVTTLDDYLHGKPCDFIKIDTEGHELSVLKGSARTLARFKPVIMIEIVETLLRHAGTSRAEVYNYLAEFGYQPFSISYLGKLSPINVPRDGNLIVFQAATASPRPDSVAAVENV